MNIYPAMLENTHGKLTLTMIDFENMIFEGNDVNELMAKATQTIQDKINEMRDNGEEPPVASEISDPPYFDIGKQIVGILIK